MKISNSKKQLAKIISENGGWPRNADWAAQCKSDSTVSFYYGMAPYIEKGDDAWYGDYLGAEHDIDVGKVLPNWHQTILSRDEYSHLYPAPDADGWIEWKGGECPVKRGEIVDVKYANGVTNFGISALTDKASSDHVCGTAEGMLATNWGKGLPMSGIAAYRLHKSEDKVAAKPECTVIESRPTIEQLATEYRNRQDYAERKQQEADAAMAEAEAKLAELVAAGKAVGLVVRIAAPESELVITDWRDLQVGDVVEVTGSDNPGWIRLKGVESVVTSVGTCGDDVAFCPRNDDTDWAMSDNTEWRFIRRPAKGDANA